MNRLGTINHFILPDCIFDTLLCLLFLAAEAAVYVNAAVPALSAGLCGNTLACSRHTILLTVILPVRPTVKKNVLVACRKDKRVHSMPRTVVVQMPSGKLIVCQNKKR